MSGTGGRYRTVGIARRPIVELWKGGGVNPFWQPCELTAVLSVIHIAAYIYSPKSSEIRARCIAKGMFGEPFELELYYFADSEEQRDILLNDLKVGSFLRVQGDYSVLRGDITLYNPVYEKIYPDAGDSTDVENSISAVLLEEGSKKPYTRICVIGVGGFGGKVINEISGVKHEGVTTILIDTTDTPLKECGIDVEIWLGGDHPAQSAARVSRAPVMECERVLAPHLENAEAVIVIAGMGGYAGSVIATVIANISKKRDLFTVGIAATPFAFEGEERSTRAEKAIAQMKEYTDTMITIPFEGLTGSSSMLYSNLDNEEFLSELFRSGLDIVVGTVRDIGNFLLPFHFVSGYFRPGDAMVAAPYNICQCLDAFFGPSEIKKILRRARASSVAYSEGIGKDCMHDATQRLIEHPHMWTGVLQTPKTVLLDIAAGPDVDLGVMLSNVVRIRKSMDRDLKLMWAVVYDDALEGRVQITAIILGVDK